MGPRLLSALVGAWLVLAPGFLRTTGAVAASERVAGVLAIAASLLAVWGVTRPLRWLNLLPGGWLMIAPLVLAYGGGPLMADVGAGVVLVILTLVRGRIRHLYGGGWAAAWGGAERAGRVG